MGEKLAVTLVSHLNQRGFSHWSPAAKGIFMW
jgi:hypothetical protein